MSDSISSISNSNGEVGCDGDTEHFEMNGDVSDALKSKMDAMDVDQLEEEDVEDDELMDMDEEEAIPEISAKSMASSTTSNEELVPEIVDTPLANGHCEEKEEDELDKIEEEKNEDEEMDEEVEDVEEIKVDKDQEVNEQIHEQIETTVEENKNDEEKGEDSKKVDCVEEEFTVEKECESKENIANDECNGEVTKPVENGVVSVERAEEEPKQCKEPVTIEIDKEVDSPKEVAKPRGRPRKSSNFQNLLNERKEDSSESFVKNKGGRPRKSTKINFQNIRSQEKHENSIDDPADDGVTMDEKTYDDDVISIDSTPEKSKKTKKPAPVLTPIRRSSRNLNKQRSYVEREDEEIGDEPRRLMDDDDVEVVTPVDPLADEPPRSKPPALRQLHTSHANKPIVVSDTKGLVEFAATNAKSRFNKKEPTLVIIDTNSILSGRGPIPIQQQHGASAPIPVSLPIPSNRHSASTSSFSVIPIGGQSRFTSGSQPPPMKPITVVPASVPHQQPPAPPPPPPKPQIVLPSLTDDMFVVEAPSFIVPYVYEKPPMKSLKEYVEKLEAEIKEAEMKEAAEREQVEKEERERAEKEERERKEKEGTDDGEKSTEDGEKIIEEEKKTDEETSIKDEEKDTPMEVDKENDKSDVTAADSTKKPTEETPPADKKEESPVPKEPEKKPAPADDTSRRPASYFDNPLGKFFIHIGLNQVQEHVQADLLRSQKRKRDKEGTKCLPEVASVIDTLTKSLECSKENNDPYKLEMKKCDLCSFKTESKLVMAHHLETPHMKNYTYRCNFCPMEVRSPHDILYHMEAEHNVHGRLDRAPAFHQCPNCPFEDNQKGKLTRHMATCAKKYRPERNQEPPLDWEPPAKIPRVTRNRPPSMNPGNAVYQAAITGLKQMPQNSLLPKLMPSGMPAQPMNKVRKMGPAGMQYRNAGPNSQAQLVLPQGYQLSGAQIYQQNSQMKQASQQTNAAATKLINQPSISITPLPRQNAATGQQPSTSAAAISAATATMKPGKPQSNSGGKNSFVVCEICDGYIKDLEQLRNHMQWIHKVKIHPKMIYNRPPLNCQKCQFRFFTDQGLERHLLGSHGLVTSSMQEAANKGRDGGRCPVCGRVYQWKLLNHVARDHQMALKPAHLSYKCTVCTATFGMYKQFEGHVYSAHSVVAKRAMEKKPAASTPSATTQQNEALMKPLKINDEITIIPQPVRNPKLGNKNSPSNAQSTKAKEWCNNTCESTSFPTNRDYCEHVRDYHLKEFQIRLHRLELVDDDIRNKYKLKEFNIRLKRLRNLKEGNSYRLMLRDALEMEDNMHMYMPEVICQLDAGSKTNGMWNLRKWLEDPYVESETYEPDMHFMVTNQQRRVLLQYEPGKTLQTPRIRATVRSKLRNDQPSVSPVNVREPTIKYNKLMISRRSPDPRPPVPSQQMSNLASLLQNPVSRTSSVAHRSNIMYHHYRQSSPFARIQKSQPSSILPVRKLTSAPPRQPYPIRIHGPLLPLGSVVVRRPTPTCNSDAVIELSSSDSEVELIE